MQPALTHTKRLKGRVHPCTYMQTDTTIPLLSWWAVGGWPCGCGCGMQISHFGWPKQKHEKFAKINLYYVHKFIEPLALPEPAKGHYTHTHTLIRTEDVLAVFDMQISTVASSGCVNTQNSSQSTVAGHGQDGEWVAGHYVGLVA